MTEKILEVVAALIWDGDKFFACQRPMHKARGGLWEFVGGKVEKGETKEAALIRECREELDAKVAVDDVFMDVTHPYPDITVHLTLFNARFTGEEPKLIEHQAFMWVKPEKADETLFCPADKEILAEIRKRGASGLNEQTNTLMNERFGKDSLIALATAENNMPFVRTVNACYRDGAFYVITHALSGKMQQIKMNPAVSICGDWFTAQGTGENLGYVGKAENKEIVQWLKEKFSSWIDNGHTNFADENTVLLKIRLKTGVLYADGNRHEIDFT